jgi:hypothetical protein
MTDNKNLNPLQQWKENLGETRPWDLLNKENFVEEEVSKTRIDICKKCSELIKLTTQCKKCGCFMKAKTKLIGAVCPIGKW